MMFSLGIATMTFAVFLGSTQIAPDAHQAFLASLQAAFTIFSVLCTPGIFASLARGKVHGAEPAAGDTSRP